MYSRTHPVVVDRIEDGEKGGKQQVDDVNIQVHNEDHTE